MGIYSVGIRAETERRRPMDLIRDLRSCQVQTPASLAEAMIAGLGDRPSDRWLEPCVGGGSLLSALAASGVGADRIRGLDLDPEGCESDRLGQVLRGTEFLRWAGATDERFEKIVANPPYLPLSKCPSAVFEAAIDFAAPIPLKVRPGSNCWSVFLIASLKLLREAGSLCFVLPAAWEYADYAADLRHTIDDSFEEVLIYRSLAPLFPAVQEGSVVLLARGYRLPPTERRHFDFDSPQELIDELRVGPASDRKAAAPRTRAVDRTGACLGDEIRISIGAVTGDSKFFLMSEPRRLELSLPRKALLPVVTRARQLRTHAVDRQEWERLRDAGERVWLFRPADEHLSDRAVESYLSYPEADGGCRKGGYKIIRRSPWHRTRLPVPPHGFLSGMTSAGPWIALNRMRTLTATNTLYTVRFRTARTLDERAAWSLALFTTRARESMRSFARRYADGLQKFEPGDLRNISVPTPTSTSGALRKYEKAVSVLLINGPEAASMVADSWFMESGALQAR